MTERRRHARCRKPQQPDLRITYTDSAAKQQVLKAKLLDASEAGIGVETSARLPIGAIVRVTANTYNSEEPGARARVSSCLDLEGRPFRLGLCFEGLGDANPFYNNERTQQRDFSGPRGDFVDYYEILQLSPNAEPEIIHRSYRLLAQRYHPDNSETGDEEFFKQVLRAYRVLSDPEQRAGYDLQYRAARKLQWKIFDQPKAAHGVEGQKRQRHGILALLYTKRMHQPDQASVTIMEMEDLLGCPREHLEFSLWYLKENGSIVRSDNGRFFITVKGVDQVEANGDAWPREDRLLTTDLAVGDPRQPGQNTWSNRGVPPS